MRRTGTLRSSGTRPVARGSFHGLVGPLAHGCAAAVLGMAMIAGAAAQSGPRPFGVGFSTNLFTSVNDADAKASIRAWAQTVARERGIAMNPTAQLYDHTEEMIDALKSGAVDAMSMTFDEYMVLSKEVATSHWFVTQTSGSLFEVYILVVNADAGITDLGMLEGHPMIFHDTARTSLAMDWLDHLVLDHGHDGVADDYFGAIRRVNKVSAAVLPVFFGKADAALVAESNFEVMCELNPQLRQKVKTIARSRPLVPAIMCFRKNFESPEKERIMAALQDLHQTPAGEQVLTIFQSQALVLVDENPLIETAAFLEETNRLRLRTHGKPANRRPSGATGKGP